ncbi:hypothetical protein P3T76_001851 [Phytophthora citrophthora]|uniref:Reverse transcriptase n=1 Tax=Phytophthora citrophthora TaxID=4793 RepID=A0AAD9LQS6_9STRA|nr:hypothetical protein P3T76_001851 [Phytophthora citrophthora]
MQDDKPNLVILNVMSKRVNSLRALVGSGASNNFVRQGSLRRFDFEETDTPRGVLEVRLATGATVRSEKRVVRVRFSYKRRTFVEDLIVLDLDDKFDLVLGMPWLARHDPVINWEKRTLVRFNNTCATESDGPVSAVHAPDGACNPPVEAAASAAASDRRRRPPATQGVVGRKCVSTQKSEPNGRGHMSDGQVNAIHLREGIIPVLPVSLEVLQAPKGRADDVASTLGVDEAKIIRGTERRASALGADATGASLLVPGTSEHSLALEASESTSTPGVDDAVASSVVSGWRRWRLRTSCTR